MCLYTRQSSPITAEQDIIVYKVLEHVVTGIEGLSPFRSMIYYKGVLRQSSMTKATWDRSFPYPLYEISEGLHACTTYGRAQELVDELVEDCYGLEVFTIIKMIIPQGAHFYLGEQEDIVSDQLLWPNQN